MIYQIKSSDAHAAIQDGANLLCFSYDGTEALVISNTLPMVTIIAEFNDSKSDELQYLSFWKQPCIDC